jgi:hypothetical protein
VRLDKRQQAWTSADLRQHRAFCTNASVATFVI